MNKAKLIEMVAHEVTKELVALHTVEPAPR